MDLAENLAISAGSNRGVPASTQPAPPQANLPAGQAHTLLAAASAFDNGYAIALAITAVPAHAASILNDEVSRDLKVVVAGMYLVGGFPLRASKGLAANQLSR